MFGCSCKPSGSDSLVRHLGPGEEPTRPDSPAEVPGNGAARARARNPPPLNSIEYLMQPGGPSQAGTGHARGPRLPGEDVVDVLRIGRHRGPPGWSPEIPEIVC